MKVVLGAEWNYLVIVGEYARCFGCKGEFKEGDEVVHRVTEVKKSGDAKPNVTVNLFHAGCDWA